MLNTKEESPEEAAIMSARRRLLGPLAACLGLLVVAGCGDGLLGGGAVSVTTSQPVPTASSPSPSPQGVNIAAFDALAKQEASAWPRSPLGQLWKTSLVIPSAADLTFVPNDDLEPAAVMAALGNGDLVYTGPPPSRYGPAAVVTWTNTGARTKVPVLSEAQTFSALKNNALGRCPNCHTTPLAVTNAQPDTMPVPTNRGTAVVPAWLFSIPAMGEGIEEAALAPGSYVTENSARGAPANLGPLGAGFVGAAEASALTPDGRTLGMYLDSDPCDPPATWGGLVAEVGDVVVVGGWIHDPHPITSCVAGGQGQYVTVHLAAPLGDRVILDAATGSPAPYPFNPAPAATK